MVACTTGTLIGTRTPINFEDMVFSTGTSLFNNAKANKSDLPGLRDGKTQKCQRAVGIKSGDTSDLCCFAIAPRVGAANRSHNTVSKGRRFRSLHVECMTGPAAGFQQARFLRCSRV